MALIAERSRANEMRHLIKWRTCENDIFFLSDRMSAILLKQMVHSLAIPPVDANTRGVKVARSSGLSRTSGLPGPFEVDCAPRMHMTQHTEEFNR